MKSIRDRWADIRDEAILLGVSGGTAESHLKFIQRHNLPFPLIYDESGEISEAYGARKHYSVVGFKFSLVQRTTIVIDETGRIAHVLEKVKIRNHLDDLLELLRE